MRKTLLICSFLIAALYMIGCSEDEGIKNNQNQPEEVPGPDTPEDPENPNGPEEPEEPNEPEKPKKPEITVTEVEVTYFSYTFELTTTIEGEYGFICVKEGFEVPMFQDWFASNSGEITDKETITIENLNDNTVYNLYVVLRSKADGTYSDPKKVSFTTPDDGEESPIIVENVTYDTITFTINIAGSYVFQCIDKAYLEYMNVAPEVYIQTEGIGVPATGYNTVEWYDGGKYGDYDMRVREDSDYYIIAAITDGKTVTDQIFISNTRTPKRPQSTAGLTTELKNITSTSVTIATTPTSGVSQYYVYVRDKEWADGIVEGYGESMLVTLVKYPSSGAWNLTSANEAKWEGLAPNTEYYCMVVVLDNSGAESFTKYDFVTSQSTLPAPSVELSMTRPKENSDNTLAINIYSEDASSVRVAFEPKGDIAVLRKDGKTDEAILKDKGYDLSASEVESVRTTGLSMKVEELYPSVEYVAIVGVKNSEQTQTLKVTTMSTSAKPVPARVESDLFTSLLGEWEVSYTLQQFNLQNVSIEGARVTIAQGADATTEKRYREHNRLVILNWPFNVTSQGTHDAPVMQSPEKLMNYDPDYWGAYPELAYRDYGPKIFLEIGAGDVVTVPTSRNEYLYNWSAEDGIFYFFGCDLNNQFTAPATFPVTISADGNTITIGTHNAGAEFNYGSYRPAVFRNQEPWAIATSDIVLKRVK